jgi:hypothetical protein
LFVGWTERKAAEKEGKLTLNMYDQRDRELGRERERELGRKREREN